MTFVGDNLSRLSHIRTNSFPFGIIEAEETTPSTMLASLRRILFDFSYAGNSAGRDLRRIRCKRFVVVNTREVLAVSHCLLWFVP